MTCHLEVYYQGFDSFLDKEIEKAVGKQSSSSGFCIPTGERDMCFTFKRIVKGRTPRQQAALAKRRVLALLHSRPPGSGSDLKVEVVNHDD